MPNFENLSIKITPQAEESKSRAERKEKEFSPEKENPFDLEFYVTDHSADHSDTAENLEELYVDIKKDGVDSVRYDWRWKNIEPKQDIVNQEQVNRYQGAREKMKKAGLEEPTIILSDLPSWAIELYKKDKEKFFEAFRQYAEKVRDSLPQDDESKISRIQILNELNNKVYTPIETEDVGELCDITREVFREYNPDIKLSVTVLAANIQKATSLAGMGEEIENFLPKLKGISDKIDTVVVDYYPGLWHLPFKEANWKPKDIFKQLGLLKKVFEEIATWGKEYELGEVGLPTKMPWGGEKTQRYFYDVFSMAFKQLLLDFHSHDLKLPSRVGLYEAVDEAPRNIVSKIIRKTTPFPEHDMGMRQSNGKRKLVLQGKDALHPYTENFSEEEQTKRSRSQLKRIINYLRAPMKKAEKN